MDDWRSYDSVAETYARIHAPRLAEPARDLVALTGVGAGQRVLDVGTGTGVAATAAAAAGGAVIGIDEAHGMLVQARAADGGLRLAAAGCAATRRSCVISSPRSGCRWLPSRTWAWQTPRRLLPIRTSSWWMVT